MKFSYLLILSGIATCGIFMGTALPAFAVDHDNIDSGRPLDFDDAETVALHEKAFEFGGGLAKPRGGNVGAVGDVEFLYGFAKNWHLNVGLDPAYLAENGGKRRFDLGDVGIGVQHNFNRETESTPAFGFRADAYLPTGRSSSGTDFRLRTIASKKFGTYGRLHLNADLNVNNSPAAGERKMLPGVLLGYSVPLGFPTRFDRTMVAQVGYRANPESGRTGLLNVGLGLRQQVTPRAVFDIGIKSDISGSGNARESYRLSVGYSTAF